jgi:hypothetical protein
MALISEYIDSRLIIGWTLDYKKLLSYILENERCPDDFVKDPTLIDINKMVSQEHRYKMNDYHIIRTNPIPECPDSDAWYFLSIKVNVDGEDYLTLTQRVTGILSKSSLELPTEISRRLGSNGKFRIFSVGHCI